MAGVLDRAGRDRLRWRCRRGLLELDIVLGRYLERHAVDLDGEELAALGRLLDMPDNDLWDVVSGRSEQFDPGLKGTVARLRAA